MDSFWSADELQSLAAGASELDVHAARSARLKREAAEQARIAFLAAGDRARRHVRFERGQRTEFAPPQRAEPSARNRQMAARGRAAYERAMAARGVPAPIFNSVRFLWED